jgi:hypothetical protein
MEWDDIVVDHALATLQRLKQERERRANRETP